MSTDLLEGTPVGTFFWPGVCLLAIAVASLLAVVGLLLRWPWRWALPLERSAGFRWPWIATVLTATVVLAFEILGLYLIPFHPVMHPLLLAGSTGILALAAMPAARHHFRVHP